MIVVAAAALISERRVFVQRRPDGKTHGGLWEFPGGKIERNELPEDGLRRELREELGIAAGNLAPLMFAAEAPVLLLLYHCADWSGQPVCLEASAGRWVGASELRALAMPPADRPLIPALDCFLTA